MTQSGRAGPSSPCRASEGGGPLEALGVGGLRHESDPGCQDPRDLGLLFREHVHRVRGLARTLVGCAHDAEDVVSDVFLAAVRRADDLPDDRGAIVAWLMTTTRLVALNRRRTAARRERLVRECAYELVHSSPDVERQQLARMWLVELLERLPAPHRGLLIDALLIGLPHDELARRESVAVSTISARVSRARAQVTNAAGS